MAGTTLKSEGEANVSTQRRPRIKREEGARLSP
jgi:hypothetical protein